MLTFLTETKAQGSSAKHEMFYSMKCFTLIIFLKSQLINVSGGFLQLLKETFGNTAKEYIGKIRKSRTSIIVEKERQDWIVAYFNDCQAIVGSCCLKYHYWVLLTDTS